MNQIVDSVGLWYNIENNVFTDDDGFIVWSLFELVRPNDIFLFKRYQENQIVKHRTQPNTIVELFWPENEEDEEY